MIKMKNYVELFDLEYGEVEELLKNNKALRKEVEEHYKQDFFDQLSMHNLDDIIFATDSDSKVVEVYDFGSVSESNLHEAIDELVEGYPQLSWARFIDRTGLLRKKLLFKAMIDTLVAETHRKSQDPEAMARYLKDEMSEYWIKGHSLMVEVESKQLFYLKPFEPEDLEK